MAQTIENIIYLMQTDESEDAPKDAIQWCQNLFKTREVESPTLATKIANLVRSIAPDTVVLGERSGSAGSAAQMLFEAGSISIDLRVSKDEDTYKLAGQILGSDDVANVSIAGFSTSTDEFGSFRFNAIEEGEYDILVSINDEQIRIENVRIG